MCILGTHHCGKELCEEFKRQSKQHSVLFRRDYAEPIVSSFSHQIQYEYYGVNRSVSIELISFDNSSASDQASSSLTSDAVSLKEMFHSFL